MRTPTLHPYLLATLSLVWGHPTFATIRPETRTSREADRQRSREEVRFQRDDHPGPLRGVRGVTDNASLRKEARDRWYGTWDSAFHRHLLQAAGREREERLHLLPGAFGEDASAPPTGSWRSLGPTRADSIRNGSSVLAKTDGGRPRNILVDPSNPRTLYLCTAGGGVWKTLDGGSSWTPLTDGLGTLSCGALALDPTRSSVLYLGLGDPFDGTGLGLVKSTDGGATWGPVVTLGASRSVRSLLVSPRNPQIVLASTDAGLYRSTDGGASFTQIPSVGASAVCWDLVPAGANDLILTVEGRILRSTDDGATWTATTGLGADVTRISAASAPSNPSILYAMASNSSNELQGVYKSLDGGVTWSALTTGSISKILGGQGFYNHLVLVDRNNPEVVYLGGQLTLYRSTNGGGTWAKLSDWLAQGGLPYIHADMHCAAQDSEGTLYVGSDGGVFRSKDNGATWDDTLNIGVTTHLIYSIGSSLAAPDAVIGGFQDNGTRVRKGSTSTFNQVIGGDGFGSLVHPTNPSLMLGSLYYTRIQKSTDGGATFTAATTGITESGTPSSTPFITRVVAGPADASGNTVYTFVNTKVYKSTNFATSWTSLGVTGLPTTNFTIRHIGAAKSDASVLGLVANAGRVYLTANAGGSWVQAAALPDQAGFLSALTFDPVDHNTIFIASVAGDATKPHLWKSSNFGGSWTILDGSGLPAGVPVNQVVVDPGDRRVVYAATHLGLYRSADAGSTWTRWGTGLPLVNVTDLWVAPDSSLVRVATFGRGFWELQGPATVVAPAITSQPQSQTVTAGRAASFSVTANGTAPLAYQWKKNGVAISGATAAAYTTPDTTTADSGSSFTVAISNSAGSVTSNAALLTVQAPTPQTTPIQEKEPNDSRSAANLLAARDTLVKGSLSSSTDKDYFRVNLPAGATLASTLAPAPTVDFELFLYDRLGKQLAASENGTGLSEAVTYKNTGTSTKEVYLAIKPYTGSKSGTWTLRTQW